MEKYILYVERRDRKDPWNLSGMVEIAGKRGTRTFRSPESLWRILTTPWGASERTGRRAGDGDGGSVTLATILKQIAEEDD